MLLVKRRKRTRWSAAARLYTLQTNDIYTVRLRVLSDVPCVNAYCATIAGDSRTRSYPTRRRCQVMEEAGVVEDLPERLGLWQEQIDRLPGSIILCMQP
jgi:hypothetical protein